MERMPDRNKWIEALLRHSSGKVRQEAVCLTVDTGELLRLLHEDESADVRRAALEQLSRLSERFSPDEREKLFHVVNTDYDTLYPLPVYIYGWSVCPDCGRVLDKALKESGLRDDAEADKKKAAGDRNAAPVLVCPRCGRKENYDFSVGRRDWLCNSFLRGSGQADLVEKLIHTKIASLMDKFKEAALYDKNWRVRRDAVQMLDDEETLTRVALHDKENHVRLIAAKKITDAETLLQIALHDDNRFVRRIAVKRLNYASLSKSDKKRLAHIALHDDDSDVRSAAAEKINTADVDMSTEADKPSVKTQTTFYEKHGAMKDAEPQFQPDARGLFMVLKSRKELNDDELAQVHLHAQSVLKAESEEYSRAQEWWSNLPKTPDRQKENLLLWARELDDVKAELQDWIDKCEAYEGLVYIFTAERKLNLRTNETQSEGHIPVTVFNIQSGFRTLDDIVEDECVTWRLYFAYYEEPEKLSAAKENDPEL